jgi:hypothetical protein
MSSGPLAVRNDTPFAVALVPGLDGDGRPQVTIVVKGTFSVARGQCLPVAADQQVPIHHAPVHHGEPATSSMRYESDLGPAKPGTDVILVGQAWSARPVDVLTVGVAAGDLAARVRVSGDRQWRKGWLGWSASEPVPFERMPLVYERAYGGSDPDLPPGPKAGDGRNPVGVGFRRPAADGDQARNALPNIEDPQHPLASPRDRSAVPAGVGLVSPGWLPRRSFAGTYDAAWQAARAPFLPSDFDPRFLLAASPGLSSAAHFRGGEAVRVENAGPDPVWAFALPTATPAVGVRLAGGTRSTPPLALDTVVLEPEPSRVVLTWRAVAACPRHWMDVERVAVMPGGQA